MSKNLVFGEKAKNVTMKLYSWEKALIKAYIKFLRDKKRKELGKEKKDVRRRDVNGERQKLGEISGTKSR